MSWRRLIDKYGLADIMTGDQLVASMTYHLVVEADLLSDSKVVRGDGDGAAMKRAHGSLDVHYGDLPLEPLSGGSVLLRIERDLLLRVEIAAFLPEARLFDFVSFDALALDEIVARARA